MTDQEAKPTATSGDLPDFDERWAEKLQQNGYLVYAPNEWPPQVSCLERAHIDHLRAALHHIRDMESAWFCVSDIQALLQILDRIAP